MEKESLLKLKKKIKAKKPNFFRQDAHKKAEIGKKWRRPRGLQSKMRLKLKGYRKSPSKGYKSPALVRGTNLTGLLPVMVYSKRDLEKIDIKKEAGIIAKTIGLRKKIELVNYAKEKGIKILNIKDFDQFLTKANERLKGRKERKEKRKEKKEKKKTAKPKKKEDLSEKLTEEEKKEQKKKEQDKLLIKKES